MNPAARQLPDVTASPAVTPRQIAGRIFHKIFLAGQQLGLDILPRHFYSSIPSITELRTSDSWRSPRSMVGVAGASIEAQLDFVSDCCSSPFRGLIREQDVYAQAINKVGHVGFGPVEADFLFCFIARRRPSRIIQLGAGVSTAVILDAALAMGYQPEIICIDPYPCSFLKSAGSAGKIRLVQKKAQEVELGTLAGLATGDLLFVDSTHAVKAGGEVSYIILEVLPRLPRGAYVHFHDIFFPYEFQPTVLRTLYFWTESVLLHAFLTGNAHYSIAASLSMLHHACAKRLEGFLPRYRPASMERGLSFLESTTHFPSSTYLRVESAMEVGA